KRKEGYTAYSNPRGFIYQNKDKQNRLKRIDELHKFSDGTLTDVCTSLDDRLKAKDKEDHEKLGEICWQETVRGKLQDASTDHMICHMMSLSFKGYDKHALWGISNWGRKHQQFYEFAVNRESARDVYSKRRIIAVTELKIVE
nr:hypothetical protein [Tanacetum cinerariifolium]